MKSRVRRFCSVTFLLALLTAPGGSAEAPFDFALVGDYPYFPRDHAGMPALLEDLRAADLAWVLHVGDLHNPRSTPCSKSLLEERRAWFTELGHPFVFTPGDNDWADCAEESLHFLALLRQVFFAEPGRVPGPAGFPVRSQSEMASYPELVENVLWERDGVLFATLHMIAPEFALFGAPEVVEKARLIEAGEDWLDEVFRQAEQSDARGVFLATQVSLWPTSGNLQLFRVLRPELLDQAPAFAAFKAKLVEHARRFDRPILVAHGDTHVFRVDKPLHDEHVEILQNVTRVEAFGSPHGHWVRVRVDPSRDEVFSIRQEWVPKNLYTLVPREERSDGFEDDDPVGAAIHLVRLLQLLPTVLAWIGAVVVLRAGWRVVLRRRKSGGGR